MLRTLKRTMAQWQPSMLSGSRPPNGTQHHLLASTSQRTPSSLRTAANWARQPDKQLHSSVTYSSSADNSRGRNRRAVWPVHHRECLQVAAAVAPSKGQTAGVHTSAEGQQPADKPRLVLLDASAMIYRAHFAFSNQRLETSSGQDTSIFFGFIGSVLGLMELQPPATHLLVVFDAPAKTFSPVALDEEDPNVDDEEDETPADELSSFYRSAVRARPAQFLQSWRHELYPGYKGQRPEMPEAMRGAIPQLKELLHTMRIPTIGVAGVEADDVIGTMATTALKQGLHVTVASPDKDFFQLLQPGLDLLRPAKRSAPAKGPAGLVYYTTDSFREEWGLEPEQWVDLLALSGDSSDNVPGVSGIGPKTAVPLLQRYGDLEGVLAHAGEAKSKKQREVLSSDAGAEAALLSKRLVTIQTDMDLPPLRISMDELQLSLPEDGGKAALDALAALELKNHRQRLISSWQSRYPGMLQHA